MLNITINNKEITAEEGINILKAAKENGIKIPTLCNFEGRTPIGACRVCLVEVEGSKKLMPACSTIINDGMKVLTHSKKVRLARKTIVELLLSEHNGDCQTCDRSDNCELRELAYDLGIREVRYDGEPCKIHKDVSTMALNRDTGKCIKCRRCVTVCNEVQNVGALFPQNRGYETEIGPAFCRDLDTVVCVQCGQCVAVCPVGAITEKSSIDFVNESLENPDKHVIVQTAPAIRAALGECFDNEPGTLVTGKMVTALKQMGFDGVFDTNFGADLTIIEEGTELLTRLKTVLVDKGEAAIPMFTSCSPGWVNFSENFYPDFLPNLSSCKSPQQMFGAIAKTYYAEKNNINPADIVVVSVMPCTAKKFECERPEMKDSGFQDVDCVLTTRELGTLIKSSGMDFNHLEDGNFDSLIGLGSGAGDIFANTGGVMEAALRTVYEIVTGRELPVENLHILPIAGLKGIKEASLTITDPVDEWKFLEGVEVKVAVANGLRNASMLLDMIKSGEKSYHFVEIMTCPGGCIGGGGQPRFTTDEIRLARIGAIYKEDEGKKLRKSHENEEIKRLYKDFLIKPLGEKSHHLLHTKYTNKQRRMSALQ